MSLWARREGPEAVPRPYMKLLRGRANGLRSAMRSALPTVVDPGLSYESTHDDDHVREAIQKSMTSPRLSVHQTSFLWALCQEFVRSTTHRLPARS